MPIDLENMSAFSGLSWTWSFQGAGCCGHAILSVHDITACRILQAWIGLKSQHVGCTWSTDSVLFSISMLRGAWLVRLTAGRWRVSSKDMLETCWILERCIYWHLPLVPHLSAARWHRQLLSCFPFKNVSWQRARLWAFLQIVFHAAGNVCRVMHGVCGQCVVGNLLAVPIHTNILCSRCVHFWMSPW